MMTMPGTGIWRRLGSSITRVARRHVMRGALFLAMATIVAVVMFHGHQMRTPRVAITMNVSGSSSLFQPLRGGGFAPTMTDMLLSPAAPLSMSDDDLDRAIQRHHPLNRLQCGHWPQAYASLHADILRGKKPQVHQAQ